MSRRKKKDRLPPFVPILKEMIKSEAFKRLTNASRVAYMLIKSQCCRADQDEVKFPYSDAEPYMDRHTWAKSIKQLAEEGFIEKEQQGGLYRRVNIYKLTDHWKGPQRMAYSIRGVKNNTVAPW